MKVSLYVPEGLNEITLDQYQKFLRLDTEDKPNSYLFQKVIEIFCNVNLKDIAEFKYSDISSIANEISSMFEQDTPFVPTFTMNNVEYGFIPKLDDMSLGEYIDVDNYFHDWTTMHKAMAVLFRPIKYRKGNKYLIEDYDPDVDKNKMKSMPLNVVLGAKVFFYTIAIELLNHIPNYLSLHQEDLTLQQKQILARSGDGIRVFTDLLEATFPNLKK